MIAQIGTDPESLTTNAEVHRQFGAPATSEVTDGYKVEVFRTRQKLQEKAGVQAMGMLTALTFGLSEIVFFPMEVGDVLWRVIVGHDVRVTYDSMGNVTKFEVDGFPYHPHREKPVENDSDPEAAKKAGVP